MLYNDCVNNCGYREIAHTADWELEVWAPDLSGLLEQAARGMYALSGARSVESPRLLERLKLTGPDSESLLVTFLSELLWRLSEMDQVFDHFTLQVECGISPPGEQSTRLPAPLDTGEPMQSSPSDLPPELDQTDELVLLAELEGGPCIAWEKEIKAVTWHQLAVHQDGNRLNVRIVFDV